MVIKKVMRRRVVKKTAKAGKGAAVAASAAAAPEEKDAPAPNGAGAPQQEQEQEPQQELQRQKPQQQQQKQKQQQQQKQQQKQQELQQQKQQQPEQQPEQQQEQQPIRPDDNPTKKRLWDEEDEDAEGMNAGEKLAAAKRPRANPSWAQPRAERDDDDASEDGISDEEAWDKDLYTSTHPVVDGGKVLPSRDLDYQLVQDGNKAEPSEAALRAVQFHPLNANLLMTASPDYRLRLFQTDGVTSLKLQTLTFKDLAVRAAQFNSVGSKIVCTASRPQYAVVDVQTSQVTMVKGFSKEERNLSKFSILSENASPLPTDCAAFCSHTGSVHVVSLTTHNALFSLKGDGPCFAAASGMNAPNQLYTIGGSKVYVWDVRTRRPLRVHEDEGSTLCTALTVSEKHYAVGSSNGVVNLYSIPGTWGADPVAAPPVPDKAFMSLATEVSILKFNSTGELILSGSEKKKDAARLLHVPSLSTFANFPRIGHHYRKPTCGDFSPNSGLMCLGNDRGRALMFRLNYYTEA
ncbi:U3 small nucleolar RNA-associated protein 18-like protein [Diplonema papillatum]|nr:U3 small nucleolar RNA-associated protein 18-like protein [Diplonema papillatum]